MTKQKDYELLEQKFMDIERQNHVIRKYNEELKEKLKQSERRYEDLKKEAQRLWNQVWGGPWQP